MVSGLYIANHHADVPADVTEPSLLTDTLMVCASYGGAGAKTIVLDVSLNTGQATLTPTLTLALTLTLTLSPTLTLTLTLTPTLTLTLTLARRASRPRSCARILGYRALLCSPKTRSVGK